jgi:hypothetical protein
MVDDNDYKRRYEEVNKKISDPAISSKIDKYLQKIAKLVDCDVELNFTIVPHIDDYSEFQESENFAIPEYSTMKLDDFINHLQKEHDKNFDVYFDPIYLKAGVNEIVDVLMTTIDKKVIIVPISNNKKINP